MHAKTRRNEVMSLSIVLATVFTLLLTVAAACGRAGRLITLGFCATTRAIHPR